MGRNADNAELDRTTEKLVISTFYRLDDDREWKKLNVKNSVVVLRLAIYY